MYLKYSQSIVSILETQQLTSVREKLLLVGIQQGFPKERIKKKIKCPRWMQRFSNRD